MTTTTERPRLFESPIFEEDTGTIATTTTGLEPRRAFAIPHHADQPTLPKRSHTLVIRPFESSDPYALTKPYWSVSEQVPVSFGYFVSIEVAAEQLGLPGDAVASESPWPLLWNQPFSSSRSRPGVVFITHRRPTIFEEHLVLHTASLPWWRPQIAINRRRVEKKHD